MNRKQSRRRKKKTNVASAQIISKNKAYTALGISYRIWKEMKTTIFFFLPHFPQCEKTIKVNCNVLSITVGSFRMTHRRRSKFSTSKTTLTVCAIYRDTNDDNDVSIMKRDRLAAMFVWWFSIRMRTNKLWDISSDRCLCNDFRLTKIKWWNWYFFLRVDFFILRRKESDYKDILQVNCYCS